MSTDIFRQQPTEYRADNNVYVELENPADDGIKNPGPNKQGKYRTMV
jgi:hypothetical protein